MWSLTSLAATDYAAPRSVHSRWPSVSTDAVDSVFGGASDADSCDAPIPSPYRVLLRSVIESCSGQNSVHPQSVPGPAQVSYKSPAQVRTASIPSPYRVLLRSVIESCSGQNSVHPQPVPGPAQVSYRVLLRSEQHPSPARTGSCSGQL